MAALITKKQGARAIGLMSGTSLDAIDVALIETDGERIMVRPAPILTPTPTACSSGAPLGRPGTTG
jgi:1,6-anhydro-N-acetylmuramate kinase